MKPSTNLAAGLPPEHHSPTRLGPPAAGPMGMETPSTPCRMTRYGAATKHLLLQLLQCQVSGSTETGCNWVSGGVHFGKMHPLYHVHLCVCRLGRLSTEQTPQCPRNVKRERGGERERMKTWNLDEKQLILGDLAHSKCLSKGDCKETWLLHRVGTAGNKHSTTASGAAPLSADPAGLQ